MSKRANVVWSRWTNHPVFGDTFTSMDQRLELPAGLGRASPMFRFLDQQLGNDHFPVYVLSHDYWTSRFGGDPNIVNRSVIVNNESFTVLGVAGAGFLPAHRASRLDPARVLRHE